MFGNILITIYLIFLIAYLALMGFAFYRVFIFCKNKDLKGYSKSMSYFVMVLIAVVLSISFILFIKHDWSYKIKNQSEGDNTEKENQITESENKEKEVELVKKEDSAKKIVKESGKITLKDLENNYNKKVLEFFGLDKFINLD